MSEHEFKSLEEMAEAIVSRLAGAVSHFASHFFKKGIATS